MQEETVRTVLLMLQVNDVDFCYYYITVLTLLGIPDSPSNVMVNTDTFTSSSVNISWTESSSPCVTNYRYNVSSTTIDSTTTSNSTVLEGLVPSDDTLCVEVATVDTANRTNSSDPVCFVINGRVHTALFIKLFFIIFL